MFLADVFFYLKWANGSLSFPQKKGRGRFLKGQWLTLLYPLLAQMGLEPVPWPIRKHSPFLRLFFFLPEACFLMISHYTYPSHLLSREHFWRILILVVPNHRAWLLCEIRGLETFLLLLIISLLGFLGMCAPGNQELFIGSLHYIWCG